MEEEWQKIDPHVFAHKSLIPLRQVTFNAKESGGGLFGGCSAGMCF
jgi:hypothetical protein